MSLLIIGSTAMQQHFAPWFDREPSDTDAYAPTTSDWEREATQPFFDKKLDLFSHPLLDDWLQNTRDGWFRYATPDELLTIKASHAAWELRNGSWDKHMWDLVFLQDRGAKVDEELYKLLYPIWAEVHGNKRLKMGMDATGFFTDAVVRKYDHDSLHESVAYGDEALYVSVLAPGEEVKMDMALLKALPHETRVRLLREEVYATALERLVIPNGYRYSPRLAYHWALRRTITSLTSGWTSRWLIDNYKEMRTPDMDYVARHRSRMHLLKPDRPNKNGMK